MSATTDMTRTGRLSRREDDTAALILDWQSRRDRSARDELLRRFAPLVRRLSLRYDTPHEPLEDLVQVGSIGLLSAIDRFDPERGAAFRSFAIPTILGELRRHFRGTGWSAHVPRGAQELALRVERASREIFDASGRSPRPAQIAEFLELDLADVLTGLEAATAHFSVSFETPTGDADGGDSLVLGDRFGADAPYDLVDAKLSLGAAIARLPHAERTALRLRLGRDLKQSEIATQMGCSQMQVSRLLRRAHSRLRELTDIG